MAVSFALRGDLKNVSEETMQRIVGVAKELGYDPARYHAARRLVQIHSGTSLRNYAIALYLPPDFFGINYFKWIFSGVLDAITPHGYDLLTTCVSDRDQMNGRLPRAILQGDVVDGVITTIGGELFGGTLDILRAEPNFGHRPIVSVVHMVEGAFSLVADDYAGGYMAASHLLDLGHRFVLDQYIRTAALHALRIQGCRKAFEDRGLDPDKHIFHQLWQERRTEEMTEELCKILSEHPEITAVMARNDQTALEVASVLRHNGYRVPEDISLVGFDDSDPLLDEKGSNILTTIHIPLVQMGQVAADTIINGQDDVTEHTKVTTMPVTLKVRGSTSLPVSR